MHREHRIHTPCAPLPRTVRPPARRWYQGVVQPWLRFAHLRECSHLHLVAHTGSAGPSGPRRCHCQRRQTA